MNRESSERHDARINGRVAFEEGGSQWPSVSELDVKRQELKIEKLKFLGLLLFVALLSACRGGQTSSAEAEGDTVSFKYATLLSVVRHDGYVVASVRNPWKEGLTLHQYILVPSNHKLPPHIPKGTIIRTPLKQAIMFTTVHCAMLMELGRENCIAGVADLKYIKIPWIHEQVKAGRMTDVGDGMGPVIEKIIDRRPDAIFLSPFENSGGYGKLEEIDIPLVECAEYMEKTPLGRAEWLRFYGILFGCEQKADSLFEEVDRHYNALKALAHNLPPTGGGMAGHPSVLLDKITGSVWYVPGGKSTIGQMIQDANGHYPWATDNHSGSVSLPFETVLEKAGEADVWLFRYSANHPITYDELLQDHHGYQQFLAYRNKRVFGCNVEQSLFYEETPFHPDWLLNDFIQILHPNVPGLEPVRYYHPLLPLKN